MNRNVLLLNASYEPLRTINWRRAVVLVYQGSAVVVEESDETVRTTSGEFNIPSVIRLSEYKKIPFQSRIPMTRRTVLLRDGHRCQFSGCTRAGTTIDHVHPKSRGGKNVWTNVVAACVKCNSTKSDKLLVELGWSLKKEPVQPNWSLWLVSGALARPEWVPYLEQWGLQ